MSYGVRGQPQQSHSRQIFEEGEEDPQNLEIVQSDKFQEHYQEISEEGRSHLEGHEEEGGSDGHYDNSSSQRQGKLRAIPIK